jgi:membrane protein DedA with SNARE-associated domain
MDIIYQWLTQYSYGAIVVLMMFGIIGLPIPDETILIFAGYLISHQILQLHFTLLAAFLGSVIGITVSYELGKRLGLPFLHRYGKHFSLTEEKITRAQRWYNRFNKWLLVLGYFIPGVRHVSAFVAGLSGLQYKTFGIFAYFGALIWSASFIFLGIFVGEKWKTVAELVHSHLLFGFGIFTLSISVAVILHWLYSSQKKNDKSSKNIR